MPSGITSDKFLRAERRNRLESYRLDVEYRHIDRDTTRMHCDIDREKRVITKAFRSVVKTSGFSDRGIPPRDDKDTDFEKCPSYRQGLRLSNKRLLQWKDAEKQLNKFIFKHEHDTIKANRKKVIRKSDARYETPKLNKKDFANSDDVFLDIDVLSEKVSPMELLRDDNENARDFDVTSWQKQVLQGYEDMVRKPSQRPSSAASSTGSAHKLRSKSSPAIPTQRANDTNVIKRVRPHTAHAQINNRPTSAKSLPRRPISAQDVRDKDSERSQFLITKDGIYIRNGQTFDKLSDGRPSDKPQLVNNYLAPPAGGMKRAGSGRSINSLCPVREDNEEETQADEKSDVNVESDTSVSKRDKAAQQVVPMSADGKQRAARVLQQWQKFRHARTRPASAASYSSSQDEHAPLNHSKSDLGSYLESNRRSRKDSSSPSSTLVSRPPSRSGSVSSIKLSTSLGIPEDIEEFSKGQEKLASQITAERPLSTNKLVSIASVVKAALTFSKLARQRALNKMVEENSSDSHEVIRQERLRKLRSRQNILSSIGHQWQTDNKPVVDAVE